MSDTTCHIQVACAIIENNGMILATQRSATMSLPLKWEFPGGKLEAGETAEACLVRELKEELDILIRMIKQENRELVNLFAGWVQNFFAKKDRQTGGELYVEIKDLLEVKEMFAMALEKERKEIFQEGKMEGELLGLQKGKMEGELLGLQKGKIEGELLGLQKGKIEAARNLLDILDDETISEKTGIPLEQIKQLRSKAQQ